MEFRDAVHELELRTPSTQTAPDLERITALAKVLGDPQRSYPSVHITGTNGKTSVALLLTALFGGLDLSAGTYTSPHLQTVRERLRLAGRPIGRSAFADLYAEVAPLLRMVDETRGDQLTFFEAVTGMAYWWFAETAVDVGVLEVGMGGTWDATNLVRGEVAVLGPIELDHRELGSTPVEIAREKVGIIKPGASVICGHQRDDVLDVVRRRCDEVGATLHLAGEDFGVEDRRLGVGGQGVTLRVGTRSVDLFLPLFGAHQADNAALALAAVAEFVREGFDAVDDDVLREAFGAVEVPARLELVHRKPTVLLDGAHNPHGARVAAAAVAEAFDFRNLVLVLGCLADKDLEGIVGAYRDVANHVVVTRAPSPRGASAARMAEVATAVFAGSGVIVEQADDVGEAVDKATGVATEGDGVLVTGSLYTAGAARERYVSVPAEPGEPAEAADDAPDAEPPDPFDLLEDPEDEG